MQECGARNAECGARNAKLETSASVHKYTVSAPSHEGRRHIQSGDKLKAQDALGLADIKLCVTKTVTSRKKQVHFCVTMTVTINLHKLIIACKLSVFQYTIITSDVSSQVCVLCEGEGRLSSKGSWSLSIL